MSKQSGTLHAEFMDIEKYLEVYPVIVPAASVTPGNPYVPAWKMFMDDRRAYGVLLKFGNEVIDNWIEIDVYFDDEGRGGITKDEVLNRIVAKKLRTLLGITD